jgi:YVTN family beta-propeller protein
VLDTTSNQLTKIVPVGNVIFGVATTGDGKHVYIADQAGSAWDMDTSTYNVTSVPSAFGSQVPAITPDNSKVYITGAYGFVSAISTANDALISTFSVGVGETSPYFVAFTPDGKKAYVTDSVANAVAVVDTGTNKLLSRITVGAYPEQVATIPPQPPVPFASFQGSLQIGGSGKNFQFNGNFSLGASGLGIHPLVDPMSLQIGPDVILVPAGSLTQASNGTYGFQGTINGVALQIRIASAGASYSFQSQGTGANGLPTSGTTRVVLTIGNNTGSITLPVH